jgi:hypothetical protein
MKSDGVQSELTMIKNLILGFVLACLMMGCRGSTSIPSPSPIDPVRKSSATLTSVPVPSATPAVTLVPYGSDVVVDQMKIKVTEAIRPADGLVSVGSMFNPQPGAYHHYVFVEFEIECQAGTSQSCQLNPFKVRLKVGDGSLKYPQWFLAGVEGILQDAEFQSGTTVSGYIPFIVSYGDSGLHLVYTAQSSDEYSFALP